MTSQDGFNAPGYVFHILSIECGIERQEYDSVVHGFRLFVNLNREFHTLVEGLVDSPSHRNPVFLEKPNAILKGCVGDDGIARIVQLLAVLSPHQRTV